MDALLAPVNKPTHNPKTTTPFHVFAKQWIEKCKTRKRKPSKPSTIGNWQDILNNHVLPAMGHLPLTDVDNGAMRDFVAILAEKQLSPQSNKEHHAGR